MNMHPEIRKYKLFETLKELSGENGECFHFVLFTPPYRCRCQPTELQWNFIKVKAADELDNKSKFKDLLRAWVFGTMQVTKDFCSNWVQNSIDYCTTTYREFTDDTEAVIGELQDDWEDPYQLRNTTRVTAAIAAPAPQVLHLDADSIPDERGDENATEMEELRGFGFEEEYETIVEEHERE